MSEVEPTINGVGGEGFAIDGTDSFAIEPTGQVDAPGGEPPGGRRGLYLTLATGVVLLLIVVIAGGAGDGGGSNLRGEAAPSTTTATAADGDRRRSAAELGRSGDDQRGPAGATFDAEDMFTSEYEGLDEYLIDEVVVDDELGGFEDDVELEVLGQPEDLGQPEEFEEFDDFEDDSSSSDVGRYLPRRVPYVPSSRGPTISIPWTTTAEAETMTTSEATATTVEETTPTSEVTTTTLEETTTSESTTSSSAASSTVPGTWTDGAVGLVCTDGLVMWGHTTGLVASANETGPWRLERIGTWSALGAAAGPLPHRALVSHPTEWEHFWIGGADGVRETTDNGATFGAPAASTPLDVHALAIGEDGTTLLAVAGTTGISRSVDGGDNWTALPAPPAGPLGHLLVVDAQTALVASASGVHRTTDGGETWALASPATVVGAPVRSGETISWLLANGAGLLRSTDSGATWMSVNSTDIATTASSLTALADGRLLTIGAGNTLVASADGVTWTAHGPALPFAPAGVLRAPGVHATYIWTGTCGAEAVKRLDD